MQRKNSLCILSDVPRLTTMPLRLCTVTWPSLGRSYVPRFVRRHFDANMRDRRLLGLLLCLTRDDSKRALDGAFQRHAAVEPRVFWPGLALLWVFIRSPGEPLRFGNIGVPGPGRIDNLRKVHN